MSKIVAAEVNRFLNAGQFADQLGECDTYGIIHPCIYSSGDLGIEIDLGSDEPGAILQRYEIDGWKDFQLDGEPVISPVDINTLPPGRYRLQEE